MTPSASMPPRLIREAIQKDCQRHYGLNCCLFWPKQDEVSINLHPGVTQPLLKPRMRAPSPRATEIRNTIASHTTSFTTYATFLQFAQLLFKSRDFFGVKQPIITSSPSVTQNLCLGLLTPPTHSSSSSQFFLASQVFGIKYWDR